MQVSQEAAPYLYDEKGKTQWASASAELLATLAALWAFGHLKASTQRKQVPIVVSAITDNKGNESLSRKQSSAKWPLMLVNIQLSHCLLKASMRLNLVWRPREENTLADDLTNERFKSFSPCLRVRFSFEELPLSLLNSLWETKKQVESAKAQIQSGPSGSAISLKRPHERSVW